MSIDLRNGKSAKIEDFFDKKSVAEALQKDPAVIERYKPESPPKTIEQIVTDFYLGGFAVYEQTPRQGQIRIRWATNKYDCGMCPNNYGTLGLDLAPKAWFSNELKTLEKSKELPGSKTGM